jgi:hypothetical protein
MTGHPTSQTALSISEAINMACKHRDQLVAAVAVIEQLPVGADDDAYLLLQNKLDEVAPDVCRLAWGHKYVSLLFPDKLDDFHAEYLQRFHLCKLLQVPPTQPGLYVSAGRFVNLANQMGWPMNHFTAVLAERNGALTNYQRSASRKKFFRPGSAGPSSTPKGKILDSRSDPSPTGGTEGWDANLITKVFASSTASLFFVSNQSNPPVIIEIKAFKTSHFEES